MTESITICTQLENILNKLITIKYDLKKVNLFEQEFEIIHDKFLDIKETIRTSVEIVNKKNLIK